MSLDLNPLDWLSGIDNLPVIGGLESKLGVQGPYIGGGATGTVGNIVDSATSSGSGTPSSSNLRTNVQTVTTPSANLKFLPWAMGFSVFALVILATQDSENLGGLGLGFAWLVAGTAVLTRYQLIGPGTRALFGQTP